VWGGGMGAYGCTEPMAGGGWWEAAAAAAAEERHGAGGRRGAAGASGGGGCEKDVCYYSREPPPPPRPVPCVRLGGGGQGLRDTARDTHGNDVRGLRSHGSPSREHTSTLRSACRAVLPSAADRQPHPHSPYSHTDRGVCERPSYATSSTHIRSRGIYSGREREQSRAFAPEASRRARLPGRGYGCIWKESRIVG
jgi:hypothetical protein